MENYKINHELNQYDYSEGIEFQGLMPEVMEVEGIETTGASEISVKHFGFDAKGSDSLEVVDIDAIMNKDDDGGDESGFTPTVYGFISYGDSAGTIEYATGKAETTEDKTTIGQDEYTKIKVTENTVPGFVDNYYYVISTAQIGDTLYQLYDTNKSPIDIWVKLQNQ